MALPIRRSGIGSQIWRERARVEQFIHVDRGRCRDDRKAFAVVVALSAPPSLVLTFELSKGGRESSRADMIPVRFNSSSLVFPFNSPAVLFQPLQPAFSSD